MTNNINPYNYIQPGFEGAPYTSSNAVINNAIVVGEDEIPFGRMVALGTDAGPGGMPLVSLIAGSSDSFYGISVATNAHESPDDPHGEGRGYDPEDAIPVMRQGIIYVTPETDVTPSDPVFVRFAGAGTSPEDLEAVGRFTTVDEASETVAVNGCRWLTHSTAGRTTGLEVGVTFF